MKRIVLPVSLALIAVLVMGVIFATPAQTAQADGKVRVMVQFQPGARGAVENALNAIGAEFHYTFEELDTFVISIPAPALDGISRNPNVLLIEEDAPRFPISIEKSGAAAREKVTLTNQVVPFGVDMVQARDVWDANRDGSVDAGAPTAASRTLCIIDSGLYTSHEDFQGLTVQGGYTTISGGWATDGLGHGSHVAGTIAAMNNALGVVGVTPGTVNLYIVRVFGDDGAWAYSSTLIDAANHCASAGANIISMSLGGSRSNVTERRGFDSLYAQGILSIAAAGNEGTTAYSYPASYSSVVSVAAIDENMAVADFSQKNDQVELAAPGVAVLSTVPYIDNSTISVDGVTYAGAHIEYAARGSVSGALADGGLCTATGSWAGKVVLCQRGDISFYDKVMNVQNSGGAAAIIYNNVPGGFIGTLGEGYSSQIVAISLSQEDGQYLAANKLGSLGTVTSTLTQPASGYEYYDGTSMATPHVSAVAALVWSADTTKTNVEIRNLLASTAYDLGAAGRDTSYGYGLVQAYDAVQALGGTVPPTGTVHIGDLEGTIKVLKSKWTATVTAKAVDAAGTALASAVISGSWSGGYTGTATCTTGSAGTCSLTTGSMKLTTTSVTFTVTNVALDGFTYDAAANTDIDGDSTGTMISITK